MMELAGHRKVLIEIASDTPIVSSATLTRNCADILDQLELDKATFLLSRDRRVIAVVSAIDPQTQPRSGRRPASETKRVLSWGRGIPEVVAADEVVAEDATGGDAIDGEVEHVELPEAAWKMLGEIAAGGGRLVRLPPPLTSEEARTYLRSKGQLWLMGLIESTDQSTARATGKGLRAYAAKRSDA